MSAALCALHDVIARDPKPYKNLIPSFISILKQVHHVDIPWQHGLALGSISWQHPLCGLAGTGGGAPPA